MKHTLIWIRSIIFSLVFYIWTTLLCIVFLPTLLVKNPKYAAMFPIFWTWSIPKLLYFLCGVKVIVKGIENLPTQNGYIIASKHQSALETLIFHAIVPNVFYVLKKSLIYLPIAGLYALKTGCVPIDRKGGATTMRKMLNAVEKNLKKGMNLIIFPEGTRTLPGSKKPYSPGVALLYEQCNAPVVPVALNTGYCWPKNKTIRIPGTVTIEFLSPIAPGLHRRAFLSELEDRIEEACERLPHPYGEQKC